MLQERFKLRKETINHLEAKVRDRHRVMEEGYLKALGDYLNLVESLVGAHDDAPANQATIETLKTLLDTILPKKKRPIFGSLPYKNLNYPAREPDASPAIKPAYKGGNNVVSPDDTKDTPEAPLSLEIATLAQSLNWNPVSIYEYVKNNIETEWYWGCMKGAEETLRQKSGNDCDQATLLAALLRASGFPTRYVRGVIEFFPDIEKAKNLTGIDDPLKMAEFFRRAGIPYNTIIAGGRIANIQLEHIWVESLIPYANYRGAVIDEHGKTWLGLDTSIKPRGYTYNTPLELSAISDQLSAIKDEYLGALQALTPLEYFKEKLSVISGQQADSYKLSRTLIAESMKILPNSMQFDQKKITHEYTEIPDELRHKTRFLASNPQSPTAEPLFDISLDTMRLSNKQIIISYEPETIEDQEIIDSYGGLDNTPAYLVRLRPVLKVNDERVVVGKDGLPMGADYELTIELISPHSIERTTNTHIIGNVAAIGIVAGKAISDQLSAISEEDDAETILYKEANRYIDRWSKAEDELAGLLHLTVTRPIPTVVTVGGVIDVTYLLDMPYGFAWKGVYMDAGLRAINAIPTLTKGGVGGFSGERQKLFMQLSGLQGSVLEHKIFEDDFQVESISTAKLIQIVSDQQSALRGQLLTIDKTNLAAVLSSSDLDDNIKEDIINAVNQNYIVRIPSADGLQLTAISYIDWTGIGYIKENPVTGEAGYMLSGMLAGGMTAVSPNKWQNQDLVEILGKPSAGQYTTISITSPKNESILYTSPITVSGIALDPNARVMVNGIEAYRESNIFTASGISLTRGMNRITATATNNEGVSVSNSINVKYRILLRTFITFPYEGANLSVHTVDVEGIMSDPAATIEVNGINAEVSPDGRFIARGVTLAEGSNQITVRAMNPEGDVDIQTITVIRQPAQAEPIQLSITAPIGNETINRPSVLVKGTVTSTADEVWVKVNGQLADVHNGQFVANHLPLTEGTNVIIVNATDSNGGVGRAEVTVTAVKAPYVTLNANITSGIPPLTTYFQITTAIPNAITGYRIDFEGDGIIDYTGAMFDDISHAYTTSGIYFPTVTVTDDQGNLYTDTMAIVLLDRQKLDAILKGKWEGMKAMLRGGDIEGAMKYFSADRQAAYRQAFSLLSDDLATIATEMQEIESVYFIGNVAKYRIKRQQTIDSRPLELVYYIYFTRDSDGKWSINKF